MFPLFLDLKGKKNLDVDELEKQIEILGMSVKRAHGSISAAGRLIHNITQRFFWLAKIPFLSHLHLFMFCYQCQNLISQVNHMRHDNAIIGYQDILHHFTPE